jgi:hypothetical protein
MRPDNEHQLDPTNDPARIGNFTASVIHAAIKKGRNGKYNDLGRQTLLDTKGSELDTGSIDANFQSLDMKFGTLNEPVAKDIYEQLTGQKILDKEAIEHPTIPFFAASPDGILANDPSVLVEIKCPKAKEHRRLIRSLEIKPEYITQMTAQIACMWHLGARECEFISYHIKYQPKIHVMRFKPTAKQVKELENEVEILAKELIKDNLKVRKNQWRPGE